MPTDTVLLLSDPRVAAVPVRDNGEPLVRLPLHLSPTREPVRRGLADRLRVAATRLPAGTGLRVVEGHRSPRDQAAIVAAYAAQVRAAHPGADDDEVRALTSRFVSPLEVAPHVAGAAVDLTLVDAEGDELDLGTPIDATPEESRGRCYTAAEDISTTARAHRALLAEALGAVGLVNYPTEWWHWSYGDRYWALTTGAAAASYGPAPSVDGVVGAGGDTPSTQPLGQEVEERRRRAELARRGATCLGTPRRLP